jgi:vancomycin permeability regulator SanA
MKLEKRTMLVMFATAMFSVLFICADGVIDDVEASDVALVLGSKVETSGQPSARLAARLDRAYALFKEGFTKSIIVSGSTGKEGFDEAVVMQSYLEGKGIPAERIIVDNAGVNTRKSARNCADIMNSYRFKSVIIVTQYFHIFRVRIALKSLGINEIHTAHAQIFEIRDIYSIFRELLAIPVYWYKSR